MKTPISFWNVFAYIIGGGTAAAFLVGSAVYLLAGQDAATLASIIGGAAGATLAGIIGYERRFK